MRFNNFGNNPTFWSRLSLVLVAVSLVISYLQSGGRNPFERERPIKTATDTIMQADLLSEDDRQTAKPDTFFVLNGVEVDILQPQTAHKGDILVLPGWNFSRRSWGENTPLFQRGRAAGYRFILPEMGKSLYTTRFYPETRADWRKYPTRAWLTDTLLPFLQAQMGVLPKGGANFVMGLSTGARGALLTCVYTDSLFRAAALFSGDYDLTLQPGEAINVGFLGSFAGFPERWRGADNPIDLLARLKTALYIGHGELDAVTPVAQSRLLYQKAKEIRPALSVRLRVAPAAGHNYIYWASETDSTLAFFDKFIK